MSTPDLNGGYMSIVSNAFNVRAAFLPQKLGRR
jgi:hypothetical protein